ncbi:MAG: DMT family transporter [Bacillota bacterium]|nr:DMT family transporter [Bacillota bacterium]
MRISEEKKGYALIFLAGALWGTIGVFVKLLISTGAGSGTVSFCRMLFAFILILGFGLVKKGPAVMKIEKRTLVSCIFMALFCQALYNMAYTEAIDNLGMAMGAVLLYTAPVFTAFFALLIFGERFSKTKSIALAVNIAGCTLAVTGGNFGETVFSFYGICMGLGAAVLYSLSAIIGRFASEEGDPVTVAVYVFLFASVFAGIFTRPWQNMSETADINFLVFAVLYALIPTVAAYLIYYKGLGMVTESSRVPVFASVETVVAAVLGAAVFGENMNAVKGVGIILVMISIYIMNMKRK